MQQSRSIVSIALIALLFTGTATAQQKIGASQAPGPGRTVERGQAAPGSTTDSGAPAFSELDKDNKGYIKRSDVPKDVDALKQLRAHFNEADQNHDGRVDKAEYDAYVNKSAAPSQR